jgi:hypothetical protein
MAHEVAALAISLTLIHKDVAAVGKERNFIERKSTLDLSSYGAQIRTLRHIIEYSQVVKKPKCTTINSAV